MSDRGRSFQINLRKFIAVSLCYIWPATFLSAQEVSIEPVRPSAPILWRSYVAPEVPPIRLANSERLRSLVRAGKLYLTAHQAIELALENNIDIEITRYAPLRAAWQVERAQAGGTLPGVPSGASQAVSVASGQGVLGSQAAAGVSGAGNTGTLRGTTNASITQIGPVTQTLDPTIQEATTFSHRTLPQQNVVQSITPVLIQDQHVYNGSVQEGFLSGGAITGIYTDHYLKENSPTDVLNPSVAPTLSISVQHYLLQGFGVAVNGRNITIAKINLQTSDLNFKTQVIGTVVSVLQSYWSLAADYEDIKPKQSALEVAQRFYEDTKKQVQVGSLADIEITRAESQLATTRQNLVNSQTNRQQHELQLKNLISRNGVADPVIAGAEIVPVDHIVVPDKDDLPSFKDLVQTALTNRADLAALRANVKSSEVSALGTHNALLPVLVAFASESNAGLAGTGRTVTGNGQIERPDSYFVGGIGTALEQIFRRNFPSENGGAFFLAHLRNGQAQADYSIDQLQLRQTQLTTEKSAKQVQVDILNYVVALRQARARYDAAVHNRILAQQLFDAEQKKFNLGASTPYNVIQQQRDLISAQSSELAALVTYNNARISLDQTLGTTLESNQISIKDVEAGKVAQTPGTAN
ncbi:MAG TPA: TolC family protein [Bryobacteraceae bacterium]|nr:TolC family protein [Bryobacteraceae bacterium]